MTKIVLCGANGKMGAAVTAAAQDTEDVMIVAGIDKTQGINACGISVYQSFNDIAGIDCDVVVDFSRPQALDSILKYCVDNKKPAVLASTGYDEAQLRQIESYSSTLALFKSANMSLGVSLLTALCKKAAEFLGKDFQVEVIEKHHNRKVDAPSGTALLLADSVNKGYDKPSPLVFGRHGNDAKRTNDEIGVHAVRGGTITGDHDVLFIGNDEIITLSHHASGKNIFAAGALKAAQFLKDKPCGLYGMQDIIGD